MLKFNLLLLLNADAVENNAEIQPPTVVQKSVKKTRSEIELEKEIKEERFFLTRI